MATVATYQTSIRRQLGLSDTDTVVTDAVLLWALNGALKTISTDKDWPWLYTEATANTVSGTATLVLPAGFSRSIFLTVDGGSPLVPRSFIDLAFDRAATGVPYSYTVDEDTIRFYPIPNAVFPVVHAYYRFEPELVNVGDIPLLPDMYSEWVVYESALKVAIRTNNTERIQVLRDETDKIRKGVIDNYRRTHAPGRIRRTQTSSWATYV